MILISIEETTFYKKVPFYFENIQTGFEGYPYDLLEGDEVYYHRLIHKLVDINGIENCYFDFYYTKLEDPVKEMLHLLLDEEAKMFLNDLQFEGASVYYPLTEEMIPFLIHLCVTECLFTTFYFVKKPCLLWGNYEKKFPLFYENEEIQEEYKFLLQEECILKEEEKELMAETDFPTDIEFQGPF